MLNPGYIVIAKKEEMQLYDSKTFRCPHCKHRFLSLSSDTPRFITKCQKCNRWIYGEKMLDSGANLG